MPRVAPKEVVLTVPQARLLAALADGEPLLTRVKLCVKAGLSPTSGTFPSAVTGVREGSTHGPASPGLLRLGLVERFDLDVDDVVEVVYQATPLGRSTLAGWLKSNDLPPLKDARAATNDRYRKD